jgi:phage gpG-like protein
MAKTPSLTDVLRGTVKAARGVVKASRGTAIQRSRRVSPAEKAAYHQVTGAGAHHVKREFFGLTPQDEEAIVDRLDVALTKAIAEGR